MQRNPNRPAARRLNIDIGKLRKQVGVIFWEGESCCISWPRANLWQRPRRQLGQKIGRTR
jgi:hypothetical protein